MALLDKATFRRMSGERFPLSDSQAEGLLSECGVFGILQGCICRVWKGTSQGFRDGTCCAGCDLECKCSMVVVGCGAGIAPVCHEVFFGCSG